MGVVQLCRRHKWIALAGVVCLAVMTTLHVRMNTATSDVSLGSHIRGGETGVENVEVGVGVVEKEERVGELFKDEPVLRANTNLSPATSQPSGGGGEPGEDFLLPFDGPMVAWNAEQGEGEGGSGSAYGELVLLDADGPSGCLCVSGGGGGGGETSSCGKGKGKGNKGSPLLSGVAYTVDQGSMWSDLQGGSTFVLSRTGGGGGGGGGKNGNDDGGDPSLISCCGMTTPASDLFVKHASLVCKFRNAQIAHLDPDEEVSTLPIGVRIFGGEKGRKSKGKGKGNESKVGSIAPGFPLMVEEVSDLSFADSVMGMSFPQVVDDVETPCSFVDNTAVTLIIPGQVESSSGHVWLDEYHLMAQVFGTLAELGEGLVRCNLDWKEGCWVTKNRIRILYHTRDKVEDISPEVWAFLLHISKDVEIVPANRKDFGCYKHLVIGYGSSLNFVGRMTRPGVALQNHFQRWLFYHQTGLALESAHFHPPDPSRTAVVLILVSLTVEDGRKWDPRTLETVKQVLTVRRIPFEIVNLGVFATDSLDAIIQRGTVIFSVSSPSSLDAIHVQPGTVFVDVVPPMDVDGKTRPLYSTLAHAIAGRAGVHVEYRASATTGSDSTTPVSLAEPVWHALLDQALQLGIHKSTTYRTWFWSKHPPVPITVVEPSFMFSELMISYPGVYEWPTAAAAHATSSK